MKCFELNLDGLVGPTHHYAGLAAGNVASLSHALQVANPQAAALQGIQKMRTLYHLGLKQAVIPPHQRPNLNLLRQLGFSGPPGQLLRQAKQQAPEILSACFSASSMWTANAATVAPSVDTIDGRVHFTAANLINNLHRHHESLFSHDLLMRIFADESYFVHHYPLPSTLITRDEGAANHNRLCTNHGKSGIHLFIYNQQMLPIQNNRSKPVRFPARQTLEASMAIARRHQLNPAQVMFAQQNPAVVDQGVFHNDVIALVNEYVFLFHEQAFLNQRELITSLREQTLPLNCIEVKNEQVSVEDAVKTYLFNSQLVTLPNKTMTLIAPIECEQHPVINALIQSWVSSADIPISQVQFFDLKQSMNNGGGPACLRLRVVLNDDELAMMHQGILVNDALLDQLEIWVKKHYRSTLHANDLDDPALVDENYLALDELTQLLQLPRLYPFQRE